MIKYKYNTRNMLRNLLSNTIYNNWRIVKTSAVTKRHSIIKYINTHKQQTVEKHKSQRGPSGR